MLSRSSFGERGAYWAIFKTAFYGKVEGLPKTADTKAYQYA